MKQEELKSKKPSLIVSVIKCRCPRCRRGKMFIENNPYRLKTFMKMNARCPVCGQPLDMEPGFYYGTNMISYGVAFLISVVSFFLWLFTIGFSLSDARFFLWIGFNAILLIALQPPLMRISRSIWIAFFVPYSPHWQQGDIIESERINKDHMNNW
jgi:uncharacterized protein (DUF983 family)